MKEQKNVLLVVAVLFISVLATKAQAGDAIYTGLFSSKAISGYDAVAYFTEGKPIKGDKKFQFKYQGADWYFATAQNLDAFKVNPEAYAPQYGGFCAWAVAAKHDRAPGNPDYWRIVDGKLYLNYSQSVQEKWLQDIPGFIQEADKYWPVLLAE